MEAAVQPFLINSHGRMVFPSNFLPQLDFSVIDDLDQLAAVIRRDFEAKAPTGTEILRRIEGSSTPVVTASSCQAGRSSRVRR
jgi:3-oxoacyl-[acyl-carrier-protein] synthase III